MYKQNKINMENLKTIQIKDKDYVKVNPDTGEVKDAYVTRKVSMDEFIMLFFNSFPELFKLEGNALKLLMCIWKKSSYNPFEDSGNLFYNNKIFKEYVRSTGLNLTDLTINMYVSKLAKKDILIKQCQGTYMLNPLYFFKGKLSDRTHLKLVIENRL